MPRVILIDPDRTALAALQAALERAGIGEILAVTSGAFALTMLERNRPDLIVSRVGVPDIDGYELCAIVRNDPLMTGVLFLLLASPGDEAPASMLEDKPDQTLAGDLPLAAVVSEVASLLGRGPASAIATPAAAAEATSASPRAISAPAATPAATVVTPAPPAPGAQPDGAHGLRGSLAVMELPDITQAIALGAKTGQLIVTLSAGRGSVFFDRGRVVHAEFFGLIGETAFAALLVAAHGEANGSFAFNPLEAATATAVKTIHRDLKQLLLSAAAGIDEGRADAAVAPIS
jgi:CheY-like chemotaxis protein